MALAFNEMVAAGELSAPIVIGRDHLDSGSVASPNRETEAMLVRLANYTVYCLVVGTFALPDAGWLGCGVGLAVAQRAPEHGRGCDLG